MGDINSKGKTKVIAEISENGELLSKGLHFDHETQVEKYILTGVGKTKTKVICPIAEELFLSSTYGEVITRAEHVAKKLEALDCFEKVNIVIDSSNEESGITPKGLQVTLNLEEKKWVEVNLACLDKDTEHNGSLILRFPNVFGGAEKVEVCGTCNIRLENTILNAELTKPLDIRGNSFIHASAFRKDKMEGNPTVSVMEDNSIPDSSFGVKVAGIRGGVSFNSLPGLHHKLQYQFATRDQLCIGTQVPQVLRDECGHVIKSSLLHTVTWDDCTVHAPGLPSLGRKITLDTEFAGLGGDLGFFKNEIRAESSRLLFKNLTGNVVGQAGVIRTTSEKKILSQDKFFLGGPMSVRGFERRGIGPQASMQALGSDVYFAGGLNLYYRIGHQKFVDKFGDKLRLHGFFNVGSCGDTKKENVVNTMLHSARLACGLGLSVRLGELAQLEVNYCVPMRYLPEDRVKHGLQFGIGFSFL